MADTESGSPPGVEEPAITPPDRRRRRFSRPWEEPIEAPPDDQAETPPAAPAEERTEFLEADDAEPSISEEAYLSATTAEYRDLAEEIARGGTDDPATMPAVAATMAGVGTGLVDFADVTGRPGVSEEDVERVEQAAASDLTLRIISALVLLGLFMATLLLGGWFFTFFVGAVMVVAVGEFYATLRRHGFVPLSLFGLLAALGSAVAAHLAGKDEAGRLADPLLRAQIAEFEVDEAAFGFCMERAGDLMKAGQGHPAFSSVLKYYGTELNKRRNELVVAAGGSDALEWESDRSQDGGIARTWLRSKGNSIEGGTSEVQLNIIAKRLLELPDA